MLLKWFALVAVTIILVGLYLVGAFGPKNTRAAQPTGEPQAAIAMVQASPTPIPEPTLDIQATQMVQQTDLTNAQAELARVNLAIEQTNLEIQQSREREAQAHAAAAASEAERAANNLRISEEQNKQTALLAEQSRLKNEEIALTNKQTELEIQKIEAEAAARNGWLVLAGFVVLGVGIAIGLRALANAPRKAESEPESEQSEPDTQTVQIAHPEARAVYEHDIQITPKERAVLRRAVIELDGILSRRRLNGENPTKTVYFSEQRAEQILAELRRENPNGVSLAVFGQNNMTFAMPQLYQWLGLPSPLSVKTSPETAKNTAESRPTPPHAGGAEPENTEGEGVSDE